MTAGALVATCTGEETGLEAGTTGALLATCTGDEAGVTEAGALGTGVADGTTGTTMEVVCLELAGQLVTVGWQLVMTTSWVL